MGPSVVPSVSIKEKTPREDASDGRVSGLVRPYGNDLGRDRVLNSVRPSVGLFFRRWTAFFAKFFEAPNVLYLYSLLTTCSL